jgi:hypothetical protein
MPVSDTKLVVINCICPILGMANWNGLITDLFLLSYVEI